MNKFKYHIMTVTIIALIILAGCGNENEAESSDVSKEMDYTITGLEPGAGQTETNEIAIETYDNLEGWTQDLSSTGAMLSALDEAIKAEKPIVITAWSPHYMFAKWDIKYLEDPEGVYGEEEDVITIVREGLQKDAPEAYEILDRITFELEDVENALLDAQELEMDEVADKWVEENKDTIANWTEGLDEVSGESFELVTTPWDDALFSGNVAKKVLTDFGYDVELTPVDPAVLFEAIATGESDASLSPWVSQTHGELYEQYEGEFEDLGPNLTGAKIGLAVPSYMEIDSLTDLKPKK